MAKSKFTLKENEVALVITTGEPVMVMGLDEETAAVIRPVVTQDGIEHRTENIPLQLLETFAGKVKREVSMEELKEELLNRADNKRYGLSRIAKNALDSAVIENGLKQLTTTPQA